ncbi:uncharacterized protein [Antedon mediterranea]|uniref:uncharacterized protein n=1 Tax=Antedon mediterranea TaxID=105859 RepID=UPI003AF6C2A4
MRLTGPQPHEGRVEIWTTIGRNSEWTTICGNGWDMRDANVTCRELGYMEAEEAFANSDMFGEGTGVIFLNDVDCQGTESSLAYCRNTNWVEQNCTHRRDAGVRCRPLEESIRLVGGSNSLEGRLEINYQGVWGTVCDDRWSNSNSDVACRQLGYSWSTGFFSDAHFGEGTGTIFLDDVSCFGDEDTLVECKNLLGPRGNCLHEEDVSIVCHQESTTAQTTNAVVTDAYEETTQQQEENIQTDVQCGDSFMTILVGDSSLIDQTHFPPHLLDPSCTVTSQVDIDGVSWLAFMTRYDQCGTTVEFSDDFVEYSNSVFLKQASLDKVISREHQFEFPAKCKLQNTGKSSVIFDPQEVSVLGEETDGKGNFTFTLDIYQRANFTNPYADSDYPVVVDLGQTVYFGAHVLSYTKDVKLYIDSCVATASSDESAALRYDLIQNSCPSDATTSFADSQSTGQNVYFLFDAFRFVEDQYLVYVHCAMSVCNGSDPTCSRSCEQRNKRSPMTSLKTKKVIKGPLFLRQPPVEANSVEYQADAPSSKNGFTTLPVTSMLIAMNMLLIVGVAVYLRYKSSKKNSSSHQYHPLFQDVEE